MIKRAVSMMLCVCVAVCSHGVLAEYSVDSLDITQSAVVYSDIDGHFGKDAIERWSNYGVLIGFQGLFRPDDELNRAELAAIVCRLIGYTEESTETIVDVFENEWFYTDILRVNAENVMLSFEGYIRPYDPVTREEALTVLARAFGITREISASGVFADESSISDWAVDYLKTMALSGYLDYFGNELGPAVNITRAEIAIVIDALIKGFYCEPGVYSGEIDGNVIIRTAGVTLQDLRISGDLYITEGVGNGYYTIHDDSVVIGGIIHQRGGRLNPFPHIDPSASMVALTFDDGPGAAMMDILDVMEKYDSRATFCVVGYLIESNVEKLQRAVNLNCELASHTWNHAGLTSMSQETLIGDYNKVSDALYDAAGVRPAFVRPPYGYYNTTTSALLGDLGAATVFWSIDTFDWSHRNAATTYSSVINNVKDGAIILMHDSVSSTAAAVELIVPELIDEGYQLVTLTELLAYTDDGFVAGRVYTSKNNVK